MKQIDCDVAIVGAGPAGLAAAISACDAGAKKVVLLERDKFLGGILQQCIHNGFGLHILGKDYSGPEYAQHFINEVRSRPIECLTQTMVLEMSSDLSILAASGEGLLRIQPKAVVLAMGCRERTRGAIALPGQRPAGIYTAGVAQRFINIEGELPGRKVVILGSGDIGMIMARRMHLEGAEVMAVAEIMSCIGGLSRNLVQCLHDFEIPLYLRHTITDIRGAHRVEGVDISPIGDDGLADTERSISIDCDTLLLSVGLIPENELSRQASIELDSVTGGPVVDQYFHTSIPGIFAAGNVVQVFDLVDHVSRCAMTAGDSAARYVKGEIQHWQGRSADVKPSEGVRSVVPQKLTTGGSDSVEFYMRAQDVMRKATLELFDKPGSQMFSKRFSIVRPPEMITAPLEAAKLAPGQEYCLRLQGEKE